MFEILDYITHVIYSNKHKEYNVGNAFGSFFEHYGGC